MTWTPSPLHGSYYRPSNACEGSFKGNIVGQNGKIKIVICADLEFKCHEEDQILMNLLYQRNKKVPPGKKYENLIKVFDNDG